MRKDKIGTSRNIKHRMGNTYTDDADDDDDDDGEDDDDDDDDDVKMGGKKSKEMNMI